jgi:hypothetical protein
VPDKNVEKLRRYLRQVNRANAALATPPPAATNGVSANAPPPVPAPQAATG